MVQRVTNLRENGKKVTKKQPMLQSRTKKSRVAPFRNKDEFEDAYRLLFEAEPTKENRLAAFELLSTWKARRGAETSASILSTLAILEAQIRDVESSKEAASTYAGAFTRFLNYVSSIEQKQQKRSMYSIANRLGIESFLVDLRHLCAHGQNAPSLEVFRRSADYCMNWLKGFYWERELKHIQDTKVTELSSFNATRFERNLRRIFNIYDAVTQGIHSGCNSIEELYPMIQDERRAILQEYLVQLNETNIKKIFNATLNDLIQASKSRIVKENSHIFCDQLLSLPFFIESSGSGDVQIIGLHHRLLQEMQKCNYLNEFFYTAIHVAEDSFESNLKRRSAAFWAEKILEATEIREKFGAESDVKVLQEKYKNAGFNPEHVIILIHPIDIDLTHNFIETRIQNASYFSCKFVKRLLLMAKSEKFEKYQKLLDAFGTNSTTEEETKGNEGKRKIYTIDDVVSLIPEEKAKKAKVEENKTWTKAEDNVDWKRIPLGAVIEDDS